MADLHRFKQEALDAKASGNWRKAATCYANLERGDPTEPAWGLKLAIGARHVRVAGLTVLAVYGAVYLAVAWLMRVEECRTALLPLLRRGRGRVAR